MSEPRTITAANPVTATLLLLVTLLAGCVATPGVEPVAVVAIDEVEQALNEGDMQYALAGVQALRTHSPDDPRVLNLAARAYALSDRDIELRGTVQHLLALQPDNAYALEQLGLLDLAAGDLARAENNLTLAVALQPSRWLAWNGLGVIADLRADFETAQNSFEQALAIVPGHPKVLANLGWSRLLADDLPSAERYLREALELAPQAQITQSNLAFCLALQGRYEEAMALYERWYSTPVAANNVGYAATLRDDRPSARKYLSMALELQPNYYKKAANNLARISQ